MTDDDDPKSLTGGFSGGFSAGVVFGGSVGLVGAVGVEVVEAEVVAGAFFFSEVSVELLAAGFSVLVVAVFCAAACGAAGRRFGMVFATLHCE